MLSIAEAKRLVLDKYGFNIVEESDLGDWRPREPVKGEARAPSTLAIRADLEPTMKLIVIAHEVGHLIEYKNVDVAWLNGGSRKFEKKAWLNGLPLAIELGIYEEYSAYWRIHLEKL